MKTIAALLDPRTEVQKIMHNLQVSEAEATELMERINKQTPASLRAKLAAKQAAKR